ncbi:MAG TPA: ribosome maturation factor RimM [Kofleriaceae bacterium]|jgi:16S rRNA processing protein RimM|nr:ribosome maturation factor RimM [Kofleriaceae bacterium]
MRGDPRIEIGRITRAHGIRGEVVIVTHDPASTVLGDLEVVWVGGVERRMTEIRGTHRGWLVQFEGVPTRNAAELLRGQLIEVDREVLELDDDDVLLGDLIGCKVQLADGTPWGEIVSVDSGAMQDLLVIRDGELERLLPLVDEFVTAIDLAAGLVTVAPPDGLPEHKP